MIASTFFILDKDGREMFFKESFLLTNVKPDVVLGMLFLTISNVLLIIKRVELIRKKEFAIAALHLEYKAFVIHVATLNVDSVDKMHPLKKAQIAYLKAVMTLSPDLVT